MAESTPPDSDKDCKKPTQSDSDKDCEKPKQSGIEKGFEKAAQKCVQKGVEKVMVKGVVDEVFKGLKTKRRITVKIHNNTKQSFNRGSVYFKSGTSDDLLPECIKSHQHAVFCARKTNLSICIAGCVGVIGYQIEGKNWTLAIYFRVPYINHYVKENRWNVMLVDEKKVDDFTYKTLCEHNKPISGNMCWVEDQKIKISGSDCESEYTFSGCMSNSAKSTLEVYISDGSTCADTDPKDEDC